MRYLRMVGRVLLALLTVAVFAVVQAATVLGVLAMGGAPDVAVWSSFVGFGPVPSPARGWRRVSPTAASAMVYSYAPRQQRVGNQVRPKSGTRSGMSRGDCAPIARIMAESSGAYSIRVRLALSTPRPYSNAGSV